jgi:hypothetical protein
LAAPLGLGHHEIADAVAHAMVVSGEHDELVDAMKDRGGVGLAVEPEPLEPAPAGGGVQPDGVPPAAVPSLVEPGAGDTELPPGRWVLARTPLER